MAAAPESAVRNRKTGESSMDGRMGRGCPGSQEFEQDAWHSPFQLSRESTSVNAKLHRNPNFVLAHHYSYRFVVVPILHCLQDLLLWDEFVIDQCLVFFCHRMQSRETECSLLTSYAPHQYTNKLLTQNNNARGQGSAGQEEQYICSN